MQPPVFRAPLPRGAGGESEVPEFNALTFKWRRVHALSSDHFWLFVRGR